MRQSLQSPPLRSGGGSGEADGGGKPQTPSFPIAPSTTLGPYILDFYCPSAKLVVEVDGVVHGLGDKPEHDERRDAWLASQGLTVYRIAAASVLKDPDEAAFNIFQMAAHMSGTPR